MTFVREIQEVMTPDPVCLPTTAKVIDVARAMRDSEVGAVVVTDRTAPVGIVTDRDLVVRTVAEGKSMKTTRVGDVCTTQIHALSPHGSAADAVALMRDHAIRRLPVVENGRVLGIVTLGDLAKTLDPSSALAAISSASPNN